MCVHDVRAPLWSWGCSFTTVSGSIIYSTHSASYILLRVWKMVLVLVCVYIIVFGFVLVGWDGSDFPPIALVSFGDQESYLYIIHTSCVYDVCICI